MPEKPILPQTNLICYAPIHGRNFVVKCGEDSFVGNQYSRRVDAKVTFYIYRFLMLFLEVFWEQH